MVQGGEADDQLWGSGRGAIVVCYGWGGGDGQFWMSERGAIAGCHCRCHCSVLWLRGRVTTNFGGVDVVPVLGAIAGANFCFISSSYIQGH